MTIKPRDRIALGVVVALVIAAAFYQLALAPTRKHAGRLDQSLATQRAALTKAETDYSTGRAARTSISADGSDWAALRRAVPSTSDIPALLRVLQRNADAAGVKLQSISLSGSGGAGDSSGSSATGATATTTDGATSVPLSLTFDGGYRALNRLITRLDGLVVVRGSHVRATGPLLSISNISLSPGSSGLTVQVTAAIYQLAATASAAAANGGAS